MHNFDEFTTAYLECALWSTHDSTPDDDYLDENYDFEDIAPECLAKMADDCRQFQAAYGDVWRGAHLRQVQWTDDEMAEHDFWLTRNGHGAGFWDRDWQEEVGDVLTEACNNLGEVNLYVGDDGKIYS